MIKDDVLNKIAEGFGFEMGQELSKAAPKDSTRLAKSFTSTITVNNGVITYIVPFYAEFVEFGTGIYGPLGKKIIIRPKNKKALFWKGAPHPMGKIESDGMKSNPFIRTTVENKTDIILQKVLDSI